MLNRNWYKWIVMDVLLSFVTLTANVHASQCLIPSHSQVPGVAAVACDVSFTSTPTLVCGGSLPQTGTYTVTNHSPVTLAINYVRIKANDVGAPSNVTITADTCSPSLAAGASCNVTVSLATDGPFNRILQIGINSRQYELDSPVITPTSGCNVPSTPSVNLPCSLGSTSTFGTLAGTAITNTGPTVINGDLGLSPGTSVIGFPPGSVNGTQHITDSTAATAQTALTTLYTCLAARTCTTTIGTADQAGLTLTSTGAGAVNVYCSATSILNSGDLTLSGDATSVFIFKAGSSLTLGPSARIILTGGVKAANVFWQVGSSATLDTSSVFSGTIAAFSSVTMKTGAVMSGRALARNAAVTFDNNVVSLP